MFIKPNNWPTDYPFCGWSNTDARAVKCPKCGASQGMYCRNRNGRANFGRVPHKERRDALFAIYDAKHWTLGGNY